MGAAMPVRLIFTSYRTSPLSALSARKRPSLITWNTRFPAVVVVPPPMPPPPSMFHFSFCVTGFHACRPPRAPIGGMGPIVGSMTLVWPGGRTYPVEPGLSVGCLLYTSDAADERSSVDLGG